MVKKCGVGNIFMSHAYQAEFIWSENSKNSNVMKY